MNTITNYNKYMKTLTTREIAAIKRQFKNSLPAIRIIDSLNSKIEELIKKRDLQMAIFERGEMGIKEMTGGYRSVDFIDCEYVPQFNNDGTPKMDKDGKYQLKKQVLTFHMPIEIVEVAKEDLNNVDTVPIEETESTPTESKFNPIEYK